MNDETKEPPVRELPWFLDIFLYPTSTSGLINLGIFWILPVLLSLIYSILPIPIVWGLIGLMIGAYMYYYFMECIRDSAKGGIRAPENIGDFPDMSDVASQAMEIVACAAIFWGPVVFYFAFAQKEDTIFWLLMSYGVFFFPMGLLALAMFNSTSAFNPLVWIGSIFSTFFQYTALVLFFCTLVWLMGKILSSFEQSRLFAYLFAAVFIYLTMIMVHLLGRFYYINAKKLNWEV